ncbi:MAG: hypothetical protein ACFFG0_11620 [Candidatus Thorarchaeota archaeon]
MEKRTFFIIIYCVAFFFLIFDTFIGVIQLVMYIQRGGLISTARGQFRVRNVIFDVLLLIGMSLFLIAFWRKVFVESVDKPISTYRKSFNIFMGIGGICLVVFFILFGNPFFLENIDLNEDLLAHLYNPLVKAGLIFFLLGFSGRVWTKIEEKKKENSLDNIKDLSN